MPSAGTAVLSEVGHEPPGSALLDESRAGTAVLDESRAGTAVSDESGAEPALELDRCRRLYRKLTAGVSIVSVAGPDGPHGMTASAVTSVSLRPPLLVVCLQSRSETLSWIKSSRAFGVQFLCSDQRDIARAFAVPGGPRFRDVAYREVLGVPVLRDCLAWSVCQVSDCRPYGDHHVVVGEVLSTHVNGGAPLVWHDQDFTELVAAAPTTADPVSRS